MAHLTKPATYDIKDSNIALLGSDVRSVPHLQNYRFNGTISSKTVFENTQETRKARGQTLEHPLVSRYGALRSFTWSLGQQIEQALSTMAILILCYM